MRARIPGLLHRLEQAVPGRVRQLLKRLAPSAVAKTHSAILLAAPLGAAEATIADGPLRGRRFLCRPRAEADYLFGTHEPVVTRWLHAHVNGAAIVFDIGAHVGYSTLIMAQLVGDLGQVIAFEPNTSNRGMIERNVSLNPDIAGRIRVEPFAVSDASGTQLFRAVESTGRLDDQGVPVETLSLDEYVRRTGRRPSLLKMDIEGGETRAFDGMTTLIRESHPVLIVEIHDAVAHGSFSRIVQEHRYRVWSEHSPEQLKTLGPWKGVSRYLAQPQSV